VPPAALNDVADQALNRSALKGELKNDVARDALTCFNMKENENGNDD